MELIQTIEEFVTKVGTAKEQSFTLKLDQATLGAEDIHGIFTALRTADPSNDIVLDFSGQIATKEAVRAIEAELKRGGYSGFCLDLSSLPVNSYDIAFTIWMSLISKKIPDGMSFKLNHNKFEDKDIQCIINGLVDPNCPKKIALDLSNCQIKLPGLILFASYLAVAETGVESLELNIASNIPEAQKIVNPITRLLRRNILTSLDIRGMSLQLKEVGLIVEALEENSNLLALEYDESHATAEQKDAIFQLLNRNRVKQGIEPKPSNESLARSTTVSDLPPSLIQQPVKLESYADHESIINSVLSAKIFFNRKTRPAKKTEKSKTSICHSAFLKRPKGFHGDKGINRSQELYDLVVRQTDAFQIWNAIRHHIEHRGGKWYEDESFKYFLMREISKKIDNDETHFPKNKEDALKYIDAKRSALDPNRLSDFSFTPLPPTRKLTVVS